MNKKRWINATLLLGFLIVLVGAGTAEKNDVSQMVVKVDSGLEPETEQIANFGRTAGTESVADNRQTELTVTEETTESDGSQPDNHEEKSYDEIVETINILLTDGTAEFYDRYPVDETFFQWLVARYGVGTVEEIAQKVQTKDTDENLWYRMTGCTMHVLWLEFCKEYQYQTYRLDNVTWKDAAQDKKITIDFVGDINLDPTWYTMEFANRKGGIASCISEDIFDELQSADITMVNNEFCFTRETQTQEGKAYSFKADPAQVDALDLFGADIVSLANNHTCDYGEAGLLETMDTLKEKGIVYSGAGRNLDEASVVQYFVTGGRKIAFVSATEIERFYHFTKKAGENTPGVLKTQQEETVLAEIAEARANSDYVIMFVHWGAEGKIKQDDDQRALAQKYAEAGVDAIIGSHPHRLQGVGFIGDVPVVYSLGNFWFSTGTLYATIGQIEIDENGSLTLRLLPCMQRSKRTRLLTKEEDCKNFYQYVADVSENVQIDESGVFAPWNEADLTDTPPAYRFGRQYGQHFDDADLALRPIDVVGNLQ